MAITYVVAEQTAVNGTDVVVYTCPADTVAVISAVVIGNTSTSDVSIDDIKINSVEYVTDKSIPAEGQILPEIEGQYLEATQTVTITSTTSNINIRLSIKERDVA